MQKNTEGDDRLIDTWQIHNRINLYLLDALGEEDLAVAATARSRSVGQIFAHLHNVRVMWLTEGDPEGSEEITKIDPENAGDGTVLASSLSESSDAVSAMVLRALAGNGKIRGFKPHVHAFVGYLISHEAHHRGQIAALLRAAGRPLDRSVMYGMWEWGKR